MLAVKISRGERAIDIAITQIGADNMFGPCHFGEPQAVFTRHRVCQDRRIKGYFPQPQKNHQPLPIHPERGFIFGFMFGFFIDKYLFKMRVVFHHILADLIDQQIKPGLRIGYF